MVFHGKSKMLANVIAGHHAGLFDWPDLEPKLRQGLRDDRELFSTCLDSMKSELDKDFAGTLSEEEPDPVRRELKTRLLLSALVDADYLDTEAHFQPGGAKVRSIGIGVGLPDMLDSLRQHMANLQQEGQPTDLNQWRVKIHDACARAGREEESGVFSLAVPTGGGKTLASARFALEQSVRLKWDRVIYVIPYTSIIEQNARVFVEIFGEDAVLEHFSLARWRDEEEEIPDGLAQRKRLAAENWDAPFILTTNVQFFESLCSHRPSDCRKLHRLARSVIIFDECQLFPPHLLAPTLERLKALASVVNCSLVFCTATQPAIGLRDGFPEGFGNVNELIPSKWKLSGQDVFKRTSLAFRTEPKAPEKLAKELNSLQRGLVVVNTRAQARQLFQLMAGEEVFHLSQAMCPAHREQVLNEVATRLKTPDARCLLLSTQLVEAGVDLDFPVVYRALGPLDSIIQAAGRCNREGKMEDANGRPTMGKVIVFRFENHVLPPDAAYQQGTSLAEGMLPEFEAGQISERELSQYFEALYSVSDRDRLNIDSKCQQECYRQIGQAYRWIEGETESVLTDFGTEGGKWHKKMSDQEQMPLTRRQHRQIGRYCINLRQREVEEGLAQSNLRRLANGLLVTQFGYDSKWGFDSKAVIPPM